MKTPIYDFVKRYAASDVSRFHMPGHKGESFLGCEALDITEIDGADVLYSADGIIEESERNASALFGSAHTFYSAEGSSLAIKAMLALAVKGFKGDKGGAGVNGFKGDNCGSGVKPVVLAGRNAHKAFIYACALLDIDVKWLYPQNGGHLCSCLISPADVEKALCGENFCAVYITSPDYLGNIADIGGIAKVCKAKNVPLLVDNAHGAYLSFLPSSLHPIALGADMCCDSAHKTLPVLTGGAYLHISPATDERYVSGARNALSLFASTSPSYLILQSLDLCNRYLADGYKEKLSACVKRVEELKAVLNEKGFVTEPSEPLKLTVNAAKSGYTGKELAEKLRAYNIECEFADDTFLVLMISPANRIIDFDRLRQAFSELPVRTSLMSENDTFFLDNCEQCMTVREAIFGESEMVAVENAVGRICGTPTVSCPPAIPIVVSGERISEKAVKLFKKYGIDKISVVLE
ncbi:MAG: amino acid decarboxylase [Ruminococcaceae bacterium]|nr:amino acid decarboxylase [Oscillospiraceae bacterium]